MGRIRIEDRLGRAPVPSSKNQQAIEVFQGTSPGRGRGPSPDTPSPRKGTGMTGNRVTPFFGLILALALGCGGGDGDDQGGMEEEVMASEPSEILATNAFYYYQDLDEAWDFYTRILGFETVADYGFAKMLQVSPTSYLTLVDETQGMHDSTEPKSVTLAVVTEEVEAWWEYLSGLGVEVRAPLGEVDLQRPHNGFVAVDPEGYLLEFERFNPHPENTDLIPVLEDLRAIYRQPGEETAPGVVSQRPVDLGVQATVLWLYYQDLDAVRDFYRRAFGGDIIVDQGWAKVFPTSPTGFLGFVDGERGLHSATEEKAVTVSFFTGSVEEWFSHLRQVPGFSFRTEEILPEGDFVQTFVGHDPEGYFLEWDTFLQVPVNQELLNRLAGPSDPS